MSNEPKNPAFELAEKLAKQARNKLLIPLLMKKVIAKAPFLAMPVINPLFGWLIGILIDVFYDEGILLTFFGITTVQVYYQKEEYKEAVGDLAQQLNVPNRELTGEEIKKASDEFDKKLADLIRFNN